jgi:integrase
VVKVVHHTGMRPGKILNLTWGQVDVKGGFIKLEAWDTKANATRPVCLPRELVKMFKAMPRGLPARRCLPMPGGKIAPLKRGFTTACKGAAIEDVTFQDLGHTAINKWRLQGHDYFRIMAATAQKTMTVSKRYNTVSKEEL